MQDLIPELIQHIVSFLNLEDCKALMCIKQWAEIITFEILFFIDATLAHRGNKITMTQWGEHVRKRASRFSSSYDDDFYDQEPIEGEPYDVFSVLITSNYTLEISKHDKKLNEKEFCQYVNMLGATKGCLCPYVVEEPCMIMESRDLQDRIDELGPTDGYITTIYIDKTVYPNETWQEADMLEKSKREQLFRVLKFMDLIKVDVYSLESGTRYENGFNYQIFFLMPDGAVFLLDLSAQCTEQRYESYNE